MRTLDKPWHRDEKLRSGEAKLRLAWARFDNAARRQRKAPQHGVQQGQCGAAERRSARARRGGDRHSEGDASHRFASARRSSPALWHGTAIQSAALAHLGISDLGSERHWQSRATLGIALAWNINALISDGMVSPDPVKQCSPH